MTGLYQNISGLQNEKNLTFLYRAPKIILSPLNIGAMADNYRQNIKLTADDAREMAKLTKGYPFAFQVVGYFLWKDPGNFTKVISQSRQYLEEQSYEKIWSELSAKDRELAGAIAQCPGGSIREIKEMLHIEQNELNPYLEKTDPERDCRWFHAWLSYVFTAFFHGLCIRQYLSHTILGAIHEEK